MFSAFQTFGKLGALASSVARAWTPTTLFSAGEAGGLWDFSTLANLYQDSAGTTPCTAVGDPIGKVLDTSGRGNHLTQATSTKRPVLGRMPATGVRNLLTYTEDFSNDAWTKFGGTTVAQGATAPDGTATAWTVTFPNGSAGSQIWQSLSLPAGTQSLYMRASNPHNVTLGAYSDGGAGQVLCAVTTNWTRFSFSNTALSGADRRALWIYSGYAGEIIEVWHPQAELGSTATAYQKVGAAYDVTESGVASVYTAYFDGVDDCLVSPSIDFSGTDKMTVFAGARKVDDTVRLVAELSENFNSNVGSYCVLSGEAGSTGWFSGARGSLGPSYGSIAYSTIVGPDTAVLSISHDIPGDLSTIRRNGVAGTSGTADKGTGNFGNYPFYVGQRGAVSLPYKGFISALCTRGAATDAALVTSMEKWMAARTPGVTLP